MLLNTQVTTGLKEVREYLNTQIRGKEQIIDLLLTALLAKGHVLFEDFPGTGKTRLVKALATSLEGTYNRVQGHPDLLPGDITGVNIYHPHKESFVFQTGPISANLLLVDEINRIPPKVQSALLEGMEEGQITVEGETYRLPQPFVVIATQNPISFEGTFPLLEPQLDRFMMKLSLGYPDEASELEFLQLFTPEPETSTIISLKQLIQFQHEASEVYISQELITYLLQIVRMTRVNDSIQLGASPRAALSFLQAVKAYAFLSSRSYVVPDDIQYLAPYILAHRLMLYPGSVQSFDLVLSLVRNLRPPIGVRRIR